MLTLEQVREILTDYKFNNDLSFYACMFRDYSDLDLKNQFSLCRNIKDVLQVVQTSYDQNQ